jgi:hypothetical protein
VLFAQLGIKLTTSIILEKYIKKIINNGDENGNEMVVKFKYPEILVLPAHRFYYNNQWNGVRLADRANELIRHHIERCAAILEILNNRPKSAEEIAQEHFDARLLEGLGSMMAANEVVSHCELLIAGGDIAAIDENNYAVTGNTDFKIYIESLRSEY